MNDVVDVVSAVKSRRSIKLFNKDHTMAQDEIDMLLELAVLSPTSYNIQNWRFVTITDQYIKDKIADLAHGQRQVSTASLVIVLCADLYSWDKSPERYWANISESSRKDLVNSIRSSYRNKPQLQRDEAMRSCGMAAQTIMLSARALGYDTCPMKGFDYDGVGRLINIPDDHIIVMMIAVGKAVATPNPRGGQLPLSKVVFKDHF